MANSHVRKRRRLVDNGLRAIRQTKKLRALSVSCLALAKHFRAKRPAVFRKARRAAAVLGERRHHEAAVHERGQLSA